MITIDSIPLFYLIRMIMFDGIDSR